MESAGGSNHQNNGREVLVMVEGAAVCFLCETSFGSIKHVYTHITADHSDSEWKAFLAVQNTTAINVGGNGQNLEPKVVDITRKDLFGCKLVKGRRGRPGLKAANDGAKIDNGSKELVEGLLLLARGPPGPPKEVDAQTKIEALTTGGCMVGHDRPSIAEPTVALEIQAQDSDIKGECMVDHGHPSMAEPQRLIQAAFADFKGAYTVVHDFDLNEEPSSTAMEDEDRSMQTKQ